MALLTRKPKPAATPEQASQPAAPAPRPAAPAPAPAAAPAAITNKDRQTKLASQLKDARELREQALREMNRGADREEKLRALDAEIADLEKRLSWLKEGAALEAKRNGKQAREERYERHRDALQAALNDARSLGKDAEAVLAIIADLGVKLTAMSERKDAIAIAFSEAISEALNVKPGVRAERDLIERHNQMRAALDALSLPTHFHRALRDAGVGRVGISVAEHSVFIRPLVGVQEHDGTGPTAEALAAGADRLKQLGNKALVTLFDAKSAA